MNVKRILLTGDDGYNSIGTRLLVHFLKKDFELTIVGTKVQQSGVGGKVTVEHNLKWDETMVDGIPAYCVDATPADCIAFSKEYFSRSFDLAISGINLGVNVGGCLLSSGTYAAAFFAQDMELADHAIAISYDTPYRLLVKNHVSDDDLSSYFDYPGDVVNKLIREAIKNDFWGAMILNVNLPSKKTTTVHFAKPLEDIYGYWVPPVLDMVTRQFSYPKKNHAKLKKEPIWDTAIIEKGNISISPCQPTMLDIDVYEKVKDKQISLK